ncbi:hypothetical protein AVEN_96069-1, partial [Araneus ventricosus]
MDQPRIFLKETMIYWRVKAVGVRGPRRREFGGRQAS